MRDFKTTLQTKLRDVKSRERGAYYNEVKDIDAFRKELPLKYLAGAMVRRRQERIDAGGDDESSAAESDVDELEIMRLACGKVVEGFKRLIIEYYATAFKSLIWKRDQSREKEREERAQQIQGWWKSMFAKLAVKRIKSKKIQGELDRLAEEERLHQERQRAATTIQRTIFRGRRGRIRVEYERNLIRSAIVIQRCWGRKQTKDTGMNEVAKYVGRASLPSEQSDEYYSYLPPPPLAGRSARRYRSYN